MKLPTGDIKMKAVVSLSNKELNDWVHLEDITLNMPILSQSQKNYKLLKSKETRESGLDPRGKGKSPINLNFCNKLRIGTEYENRN